MVATSATAVARIENGETTEAASEAPGQKRWRSRSGG